MVAVDSSREADRRLGFDLFGEALMHQLKLRLFVGMPGQVVTWTAPIPGLKPALVNVQPHFFYTTTVEGVEVSLPLPILPSVPIHYPGFKGIRIIGRLDPGETGWVKFSQRSIDSWIDKGGPIDPVNNRILDINDGVFEPGLRFGAVEVPIDPTKFIIGKEDGTATVSFDDATGDITVQTTGPNVRVQSTANVTVEAPTISLGQAAALGSARITDPVTQNEAMTVFISQVATLLNAPGPVIGAPGAVTPPVGVIGTISGASTKVSVE